MFVFRHQTTKIHHPTANCMIVLHRLIGSGLRVVNRSLSAQLFFVKQQAYRASISYQCSVGDVQTVTRLRRECQQLTNLEKFVMVEFSGLHMF